jgi:hypothetical protein
MSRKRMQQDLFDAAQQQAYEAATTKPEPPSDPAPGPPGVLPFRYVPDAEAGTYTGRAGLPLLLEAFRAVAGDVLVQEHLRLKQRARGLSEAELVESFLLLFASGGEHLEDFAVLREDTGLARLVGHELPAPDTARDFLQRFHDERLITAAREAAPTQGEKSFVPDESTLLAALGEVHAELMRRLAQPARWTTTPRSSRATSRRRPRTTSTAGATSPSPWSGPSRT